MRTLRIKISSYDQNSFFLQNKYIIMNFRPPSITKSFQKGTKTIKKNGSFPMMELDWHQNFHHWYKRWDNNHSKSLKSLQKNNVQCRIQPDILMSSARLRHIHFRWKLIQCLLPMCSILAVCIWGWTRMVKLRCKPLKRNPPQSRVY